MRKRIAAYCLLFLGSTSFAGDFEFSAEYTADILTVVSGGISTGTEYVDNLDLMLEIDVAKVWRAAAGKVLIHGLYNNGSTFSANRVGDLQGVNNIDAEQALRLFEFWYEFANSNWSIKTGLYDLNSEFDVNRAGSIFLNSSHGIGAEFAQTGENGPSIFPVTSFSVRAAMNIGSAIVRIAVLDGVPGDLADSASNRIKLHYDEGVLALSEVDYSYGDSSRLWLGYWRYSAEFDLVDGSRSGRGNDGWYVGTEAGFELGSRTAEGFIRYGRADEAFNVLSSYLGFGAVVTAPFEARPADQLGISVASVRVGDRYRDHTDNLGGRASRHETTWELTYRLRINEHLVIQPDIQYVRNPSLFQGLGDAWVVGCRIQLGI